MSTPSNTADQAAADPPAPLAEIVYEVADTYLTELQRGYRSDHAVAVGLLAQLRRGAGRSLEEMPELWGVIRAERLHQQQVLSNRDADRAEKALFIALTLYALHQQSRSDQDMHRRDVDLGAAVRQLMYQRLEKTLDRVDEPIRRRFVRVGTADEPDILARRLRELVALLRDESIPLDYARLAGQLYQAQIPGGLTRVRQTWGRRFHSWRPPKSANTTSQPTSAKTSTADGSTTTDKDNA